MLKIENFNLAVFEAKRVTEEAESATEETTAVAPLVLNAAIWAAVKTIGSEAAASCWPKAKTAPPTSTKLTSPVD